jgi:hypothetical protein
MTTQPACTEADWRCGEWDYCANGRQRRKCEKISKCEGGTPPIHEQSCAASCPENGWNCTTWSACGATGTHARSCERCKAGDGEVQPLTEQCAYTPAPPVTDRDIVIKRKGSDTLYYLAADGKRYVFPNLQAYKSWFKDFSDVSEVTDEQMYSLPLAGNITYRPGVKMIKIATDPKVYAVAPGGKLRWVTSESVATQLYGNDWNKKIDDVSDIFFTNYTFGADIQTSADFDPLAASNEASSVNDDKHIQRSEKVRRSDTSPDIGYHVMNGVREPGH